MPLSNENLQPCTIDVQSSESPLSRGSEALRRRRSRPVTTLPAILIALAVVLPGAAGAYPSDWKSSSDSHAKPTLEWKGKHGASKRSSGGSSRFKTMATLFDG